MRSFVRSFVLTFVLLTFILAFTAPVLAQDVVFPTNTQTPDIAPPVEPEGEVITSAEPPIDAVLTDLDQNATEAGTSIVETIVRFLHKFLIENPVFSVITALLVGVLKFIPGIKPGADGKGGIPSNVLAFAVAAVLWLTYMGASMAGYQAQYDSIAARIADFAPYILGFLATLFGAQFVHEQSAKHAIPLVGSKRKAPVANAHMPTPGIAFTATGTGLTLIDARDLSAEDRAAI